MIELYKEMALGQFEAALAMLEQCVEGCPDSLWNEVVGNHKFCQVVFHTLFFGDLYLGPNLDALRGQSFHRDNQDLFRDYEELQDRVPRMIYQKSEIKSYLQHCRGKAASTIAEETVESLSRPSGFDWLAFSRAELHPYNVRHIQHHVAQLSLRLRLDAGDGVAWVKSGRT